MNCQFMMFPPTREELLRCWLWQKDRLIYLITSTQHAITVVLQFQPGPSYSNNNNNNHPTPQACFFLLLCCSGAVRLAPFFTVRIFMVSLKQFILYHNYCLKKQHMDLATRVLEQTSQIYHPASFTWSIATLCPQSIVDSTMFSASLRGLTCHITSDTCTHIHSRLHLHLISCTHLLSCPPISLYETCDCIRTRYLALTCTHVCTQSLAHILILNT